MRDRIDDLRTASLALLRSTGAWLAAHRFWVESGVLAALALAAAYALGSSALSAAAAYDREARRLVEIREGVDGWAHRLQAPLPAESVAWRDSERALRSIGAERADPTAIARTVAVRAEEAGITDLSIRLVHPDSIAPPPPVHVGEWSIEAGSSAVRVEFVEDWPAVIGFLGSLPPQVEVSRVELSPAGDFLLRARVLLLSRKVVEG